MDVYNSEEQQVEAIKSWWKENGKSIIAGVVIGFIGLFGWRYYNSYVQSKSEQGAIEFASIQQLLVEKKEQAFPQVETFVQQHASDVYGNLAALALANAAVSVNKLDLAAAQLQSLVDKSKDEELKSVASIRLARILIVQNKATNAITLLDSVKSSAYKATTEEVKGDAYVKSGDVAKAKTAYEAALNASSDNQVNPLLKMKLADLAPSQK